MKCIDNLLFAENNYTKTVTDTECSFKKYNMQVFMEFEAFLINVILLAPIFC